MPFKWNVQPYQTLTELRDQYTHTVVVATTKMAEQTSKEAEQWMRQNAPWRDRPDNPETGFKGGAARRGLRVRVLKNEVEEEVYQQRLAEARNLDALYLDQMRQEAKKRREMYRVRYNLLKYGRESYKISKKVVMEGQLYKRIRTIPAVPPNPKAASRLKYNRRTQRQYRMPKGFADIPKGKSAVHAFEQSWKGEKSPLVSVKFSHNPDLTYAIWLEIANQGRYSIISRALDYWGGKYMARIRSIANLKQYRDKIFFGPEVSPEEQFETYTQKWERDMGRPYEPWGPERKERRAKDRVYYRKNKEKIKAQREENKRNQQHPKTRTKSVSQQDALQQYNTLNLFNTRR